MWESLLRSIEPCDCFGIASSCINGANHNFDRLDDKSSTSFKSLSNPVVVFFLNDRNTHLKFKSRIIIIEIILPIINQILGKKKRAFRNTNSHWKYVVLLNYNETKEKTKVEPEN